MIKWLRKAAPIVGTKWFLRNGGNPFTRYVVTIVEVKQGWVQYKFEFGTLSELKIRVFRSFYKEINGQNP